MHKKLPQMKHQRWTKLGHLFNVDGTSQWAQSHAAVPFVTDITDGQLSVIYSTRDGSNRSHVGRAHFDLDFNLLSVDKAPLISPGKLGRFDEDGTTASYEVKAGNLRYLYYAGWNRGTSTPFRNALGLAISRDGGQSYERFSEGPILDRSTVDPCFVAGACVLQSNERFQMWYISCVDWKQLGDKFRHYYHLKYATSDNGIDWSRTGTVAIDFKTEFEYAISQPWVIIDEGIYKMWFSYRGQQVTETYRIGYAESLNGVTWERNDRSVELEVSASGWDSEMICYPFVFNLRGRRLMLYNGNDYGRSGFGLAELSDS